MTSIRRRKSLTANRHRQQPPATLPTDIIFYQIFPRLPAKSIYRFRTVSKTCRRLPSDPTFLSAVRRLSRRRYLLSFSTATKYFWQLALYSLDPSSGPAISDITPYKHCTYAKTLNGLMLTVTGGPGGHKSAVVSNPAMNEKFDLPSFPKPSKTDKMFFHFCHDPVADRYKVLRTTAVNAYSNKNDRMEYSVLTIGKDREWTDFVLPELYQLGKSRTACINGILYCTRFSRKTDGDDVIIGVIAAFEVDGEVFYAVKYPDGLSPSRYNQCHLVDLKGALGVIDVEEYGMKLWMKGGDDTWTERRIEFDNNSPKLLSYCSLSANVDGEIVMGSGSGNEWWIFVYNMEKGEWRRVEMEGVGEGVKILGNFGVEEYVESPVSLEELLDRWRVYRIDLFRDRRSIDAQARDLGFYFNY